MQIRVIFMTAHYSIDLYVLRQLFFNMITNKWEFNDIYGEKNDTENLLSEK